MNRIVILLLLCLGLLTTNCRSNTKSESSSAGSSVKVTVIDSLVQEQMSAKQVPGVSFALIHDAEIVYEKEYGEADKSLSKMTNERTVFEAASVSKTVFAYFVLKLVDQGVLELDKPLGEYYPHPDLQDDRAALITTRMVLSHTSGLPNWRFLNEDGRLDIKFTPGSNFLYSGEGYEYLAQVLAHLYQTDYAGLEKVIQREVLHPLNMHASGFILTEQLANQKATGYEDGVESEGLPADLVAPYFGASFGFHTQAGDFARFMLTLMNREGLTPALFHEMYAEQVKLPAEESLRMEDGYDGWGLGIIRQKIEGDLKLAHGGMNTSFQSYFMFLEKQKVGFVFFGNSNTAIEMAPEIEHFLLNHPYAWLTE